MEKISKAAIITALMAVYLFIGNEHFTSAWALHFHHANIFHLLANCWAVFLIRRADWVPAYLTATVCAIPFAGGSMVGFSGVIFAALGIFYGRFPSKVFWWSAAIVLVTGMLPGISATFHLVTLTAGFIVGYIYQSVKLYAEYRNR